MAAILGIYASQISGHLYAGPFGAYDALASVTANGTFDTVTFAGIPSGYKHLQIRAVVGHSYSGTGLGPLKINLNGDTGSNYSFHRLIGDGSSTSATATASQTFGNWGWVSYNGNTNPYAMNIMDVLDYASTTKAKTIRCSTGTDWNGAGVIGLYSGGWYKNTSSVYEGINSITITSDTGYNFISNSTFALYGVK